MKTKTDVQLQLLKEIDEICQKNDLHYIMVGLNSLNAFRNHTIKNGSRITAIAMTHGDIERFCEIVEREYSPDRYVEGIYNNPKYNEFNFTYGDRNTIDFHVININKKKHHGINILIYPIRQNVTNKKFKILVKEGKFRKFLNKRIENDKFWHIRTGISILDGFYSLTGGGKRYYRQLRKLTFIDRWQDIQKYPVVRIANKEVDRGFLKEPVRYDVDGLDACFANDTGDYYASMYGKEYNERVIKPATQRIRDIVDTEFGYEEILDETSDILKEARSIHEEMIMERRKFQDERDTADQVWRLVKMTDDQIRFTKFFEKNYDSLSRYDLDNKKEFREVYVTLTPVLKSLESYSKRGMTYSISPEADKLIEDVMIRHGDKQLVDEIKVLSKKEYFIE